MLKPLLRLSVEGEDGSCGCPVSSLGAVSSAASAFSELDSSTLTALPKHAMMTRTTSGATTAESTALERKVVDAKLASRPMVEMS